jgi:hypothetical protein
MLYDPTGLGSILYHLVYIGPKLFVGGVLCCMTQQVLGQSYDPTGLEHVPNVCQDRQDACGHTLKVWSMDNVTRPLNQASALAKLSNPHAVRPLLLVTQVVVMSTTHLKV